MYHFKTNNKNIKILNHSKISAIHVHELISELAQLPLAKVMEALCFGQRSGFFACEANIVQLRRGKGSILRHADFRLLQRFEGEEGNLSGSYRRFVDAFSHHRQAE